MSKIGRMPIEVPGGVDLKIAERHVAVKGPKGQLQWDFPVEINVSLTGGKVHVARSDDSKPTRAKHGLTRSLIQNMIIGVSAGYRKVMEISGVGYRAQVQGDKISFTLGFSHPVEFRLPEGVTAEVDKKQTTLTLSGIDKQKLGQAAADVAALRPPDAYKGKGVRYAGERLKLKAGKAGKK